MLEVVTYYDEDLTNNEDVSFNINSNNNQDIINNTEDLTNNEEVRFHTDSNMYYISSNNDIIYRSRALINYNNSI